VTARVEIDIKYAGYLTRQEERVRKLAGEDAVVIPPDIDYGSLPGLRGEVVERLERARPATLGQAGRIPGVTPASVDVLRVHCHRRADP
jgi:tRNA uridine 5-carboxymethylaminomethyl modification enzyme